MAQPRANAGTNETEKCMAIVTVTAAIAALKNSVDMVKSAIATRDELKLTEMQQVLNDRVIDVQNAALALQEKQSDARDQIDTLKDDLRAARSRVQELESERSERSQYALFRFDSCHTAYRSVEGIAPTHFICQPCFDGPDKRKVVLQYNPPIEAGIHSQGAWRSCPVCKTTVVE